MEYFEGISSLKPIHVYLSFRGDDGTRRFIHRLSAALKAEGLRIFGDDKRLETGDSDIPPHLLEAIKESWLCIVVFSKNYASSSWCLEELAQAATRINPICRKRARSGPPCHPADPLVAERIERFEADKDRVKKWRKAMKGRIRDSDLSDLPVSVIPIFYDVDTSFIEKHEERTTDGDLDNEPIWWQAIQQSRLSDWDLDKLCTWMWAMEDMATIAVCDVQNDSIQDIVGKVKKTRDKIFYDSFSFVGMKSRVEDVEKLLDLGCDDEVRVIGICGMVGSGKSSIATVLYLKIFHQFDAFCFLPNLSWRLKHGDISLQELLRKNMETENLEIRDILNKEFLTGKMLGNHKFLIVIDGVDIVQDLEVLRLVEKSNRFGGGSRIIITTRNQQVRENLEFDAIYMPKLLDNNEASELFHHNASLRGEEIHRVLINRVLEYADGLPLAIELLGSFLYGKSIPEWRRLLDREDIIPTYKITTVFRKCFDELNDTSKEMFLDIACFFAGKDVNCVTEILHDCGFSVEEGIKPLVEKLLVTISNKKIHMHNMLQAIGREIVRQESPYSPQNRSRLCLVKDIRRVMRGGIGNRAIDDVKAIVLDLEELGGDTLRIDALSHMSNLRLLIFRNVNFSGTLSNLSSQLRYLSWHQYPFTCLPSSFQSDTLVQLIMPDSNIGEVWEGKMMLPMLRNMDLCGSKSLIKTPDFEGVPNLERLNLQGCTGLLQLHPSIARLSKLKFLNLRNCTDLVIIPNRLFALNSLEVLNLACCSKFAYCLDFSPLRSLIEVKLLGIWPSPFFAIVLYFLLFVVPQLKNYCL